jgi:hypothetical protein
MRGGSGEKRVKKPGTQKSEARLLFFWKRVFGGGMGRAISHHPTIYS